MFWFSRLFRRSKADAELDEEIRFHLNQETELRIDRGVPSTQAREAARRDFGNVLPVKETTRQMWGWTMIEDVARDLRQSTRFLLRSPTFTIVAVLSLALGIGANAALFSLADAVVFRDLPVFEPSQLHQVRGVAPRQAHSIFSYPLYQEIRDRNQVFSSTVCAGSWAIVEPISLEWRESRRETRARVTVVSGNYFHALGVEPVIGRTFTSDEDRAPGANPVAVVSHRFWRQSLAADPGVLDARFLHNGVSYQILGVMPSWFSGISSNDDPDVWIPMMMTDAVLTGQTLRNPNTSSLYVFGRLKPGVTATQASVDIARVYRDLQVSKRYGLDDQLGEVVPMSKGVQTLRPRFERPLLILLGVVGLLLLLACVNLAALLTARAAARHHEITVRLSLGASGLRLCRQFLTESLLLACLGGMAGFVVAWWGTSLLIGIVTPSTRRLPLHFTLDWRVVTFTAVVSILTAILFGVVPALQAARTRIGPGLSGARVHARSLVARTLLAGQMAVSLILLIVAVLFMRSLLNLRQVDSGFTRENVLVLTLDPRVAFGQDMDKYFALYRDLRTQVEGVPGGRSASLGTFFGGSRSGGNVTYEGHSAQVPSDEEPIRVRISPGFVETLGLSLVAGRTFSDADDRKAPRVAIVSESIARRYFPSLPPIGKRLSFDSTFQVHNAVEIVGVVRDVHYSSLRQASPYTIYLPLQQAPTPRVDLQVRTSVSPTVVAAEVQELVRRYAPDVRVVHTVTLERLVEDSIAQDRLLALLAGFFGTLALVLSAVGLYGITAYGVHRRTNEIGVRLALGASRHRVQWMVLREVLVLVAAGTAVGIPIALTTAGIARGLLFGLTPTDFLSIMISTAVLIVIAILAGYLPARRACRIEPIQALRCD